MAAPSPRPQSDFHRCEMWDVHVLSEVSHLWPAFEYIPNKRSFGLREPGREGIYVTITACPWCGAPLPRDLLEEWYEQLHRLLGDDVTPEGDRVPPEYRTERWWRDQGL